MILIPLTSWTCTRDRSSEQAWTPVAKSSIFSEGVLSAAHLVVGFGVLVDVSGSHLAQGRAVAAAEKKGPGLGEIKLLLLQIPSQDLNISSVKTLTFHPAESTGQKKESAF